MSSSGTPAGWYPDPENPGQTRYWDGTSWAAPTGVPATPTPPTGGGSSGGRIALIVVAVIAVLALLGGGVWALTSGDDGDDEVTTDDDDDDNGNGPEELPEAEFVDTADGICTDLEEELDETADEFFADIDSTEDLEDVDPDVFNDWAEAMFEVTDEYFADLRNIAPEGDVDEWLDLVDDWESVYRDLIEALAESQFEFDDSDDYDDIREQVEDFGLECAGGGAMTGGVEAAPVEPADPPSGGTEGPTPSTGGDGDIGPPTAPPDIDDPELAGLADDCYQGDMDACDDLWDGSEYGTPEYDYGFSCGGRVPEDQVEVCPFIEDPIVP